MARELGPEPTVDQPAAAREITAKDKDVVVIGGGDTGADCVGNALREGARSIVQLELLPEPPRKRPDDRTPWPEWPLKYRLSYAMEEAKELDLGEQDYSVTTVRFADDGAGAVAALRIAQAAPAPPFAPVRAPRKSCRHSSCCSRWASWDPSRRCWISLVWRRISAETLRRSSPTRHPLKACSPPAMPAGDSR